MNKKRLTLVATPATVFLKWIFCLYLLVPTAARAENCGQQLILGDEVEADGKAYSCSGAEHEAHLRAMGKCWEEREEDLCQQFGDNCVTIEGFVRVDSTRCTKKRVPGNQPFMPETFVHLTGFCLWQCDTARKVD